MSFAFLIPARPSLMEAGTTCRLSMRSYFSAPRNTCSGQRDLSERYLLSVVGALMLVIARLRHDGPITKIPSAHTPARRSELVADVPRAGTGETRTGDR